MDFARSTSFLKNRNFKILIAGDGPERDSINAELKRSGMIEHTIFLETYLTEMPNFTGLQTFQFYPHIWKQQA